jgi:hypothetical protein
MPHCAAAILDEDRFVNNLNARSGYLCTAIIYANASGTREAGLCGKGLCYILSLSLSRLDPSAAINLLRVWICIFRCLRESLRRWTRTRANANGS